MDADAQAEALLRSVTHLEEGNLVAQVERHVADLDNMAALVGNRQSADHHVRVPYRLHLEKRKNFTFNRISVIYTYAFKTIFYCNHYH